MDYKEMIDFIVEQFNANHYGVFIKDGKVFNSITACLVPNGIDLEMNYRPIGEKWCDRYPFEQGRTAQEALELSSEVMVGPAFWRMCLESLFTDFADVCFDRFKDWEVRSMFKTDDTVHVRFEVPKPMSEERFTKWARSYRKPNYMLAEINSSRFDIPMSVTGAGVLNAITPIAPKSSFGLGKHDWSPKWDRDDRYNSGSYSECDEWCDYVDEVMRRDD